MPSKNPSIYQLLATYLEQIVGLLSRFVTAYERSVELEQRRQRAQEATASRSSRPDFDFTNLTRKYGPNARDGGIADWLNGIVNDPTALSPYADFMRGGANAGQTVGKGSNDLLESLFQQVGIQPDGDGGFDITDLILGGLDGPPLTSEFGRGGVVFDLRGAPREVREIFSKFFNFNGTNLPTAEEVLSRYEANDWSDVQIHKPMTALALVRGEIDTIPVSVRPMTRAYTRRLVEEYQKGTRHCCMSATCDIELTYLVLAANEAAQAATEAPATTQQAVPESTPDGETKDVVD